MLNCLAVCGSLHPPFRLEIVAAAAPAQKTRSRWRNSAHTCKIPGEKMDDYSKSSGARGKKAAAVKAEEPMTDEDDESPRLPLSSLRLSPGPMAAGAESPLLTSTSLNDPVIADAVDRGNESFVVNNAGVFADTAIRVLGPGERIGSLAWDGARCPHYSHPAPGNRRGSLGRVGRHRVPRRVCLVTDIINLDKPLINVDTPANRTNGYGNLQYDAYEHPSAKPRPLRRVSGYSSSRSSSGRSLRDGYHEAGGLGIELSEKSNIYALDNGTTLGVDGDSNFEGRRDMINMRSPGFYLKKSGFNGSPSQRRKSKEHKHQSVFDLAEHGVDNEKLDLLVDKVVERLHPTIVWAMEKGDHNTESVLTHLDNVTAQTSTTAKLVSSRHSGPSGVTPRVEASFTLAVLRVNAANTLTYQQQQAASQQTYPSPAQSTLDVQQVSELAGAKTKRYRLLWGCGSPASHAQSPQDSRGPREVTVTSFAGDEPESGMTHPKPARPLIRRYSELLDPTQLDSLQVRSPSGNMLTGSTYNLREDRPLSVRERQERIVRVKEKVKEGAGDGKRQQTQEGFGKDIWQKCIQRNVANSENQEDTLS
ncbi:hypothetical protein M436DRAFT_64126 [Aureobasidium namibiae CBS 147.97]|uniref:Uncharacterized protein n=1 Tax=Aureobasidium namibiae CBS 147.97 TaxID=1043004 RepID=A0A074WIJ8_9PEZI|nr:uncharacterized protein M436DRAFT_64126 [Aureobasidium namibiae CBS 147.97]KEQ72960.1 hypothetical protein M436DRAFT_64126 [Aureobasidium namibiae CBS 147.97]